MTRREIRDSAFKLLFETLLRDDPLEELYAIAEGIDEIIVNDAVKELVEGVLTHAEELDQTVESFSPKRTLSRIAKMNLAILRLGLYEILYDSGTPMNAAIHEAVLLAQTYGCAEDVSFVNGILGAYSRAHAEDA